MRLKRATDRIMSLLRSVPVITNPAGSRSTVGGWPFSEIKLRSGGESSGKYEDPGSESAHAHTQAKTPPSTPGGDP